MKKSSKSSKHQKNLRKNKKTRKHMKKMKGGVIEKANQNNIVQKFESDKNYTINIKLEKNVDITLKNVKEKNEIKLEYKFLASPQIESSTNVLMFNKGLKLIISCKEEHIDYDFITEINKNNENHEKLFTILIALLRLEYPDKIDECTSIVLHFGSFVFAEILKKSILI